MWHPEYRAKYNAVFQDLIAIDPRPIELLVNQSVDVEGYYLEWSEAAVRLGELRSSKGI